STEPVFLEANNGSVPAAAVAAGAVANVRASTRAVTIGLVTTSATALFTGAGQVHDDGAAVDRHAVQGADGGLSDFGRSHFHEAEALGAAGFAVHHDLGRRHLAKLGKVAFQTGIGH